MVNVRLFIDAQIKGAYLTYVIDAQIKGSITKQLIKTYI